MWQNAFRSNPGSNHIFLHFNFQLRTWFIFCIFFYVLMMQLLQRGEGVGMYCKLIPDWIKSTQARIPFPAQYRTKFEILLGEVFQYTSDSKLGIWICSQARIDLNSQSKFYDVLTLYHTSTCTAQSTKKYTELILHLVSSHRLSGGGESVPNDYINWRQTMSLPAISDAPSRASPCGSDCWIHYGHQILMCRLDQHPESGSLWLPVPAAPPL